MGQTLKIILLLVIALILSSCGFQLRGNMETSFKSIEINGGSSEIQKTLIKTYKQSGIEIKKSSAEKSIEIISDKLDKRILSLNASGKVSEYQLEYTLTYRIKNNIGEWGAPIIINASRSYTYDDDNRLAKEEEEKGLIKGMHDQIVRSMTSQISASK